MNVIFYQNKSANNVVDKVLTNKTTFEGIIFHDMDSLDVTAPKIKMSGLSDITTLSQFNYFYIPKFTRYYYINRLYTENGIICVEGRCDVLRSFKKDILASDQYISRQQKAPTLYSFSKYLPDNMLPITSKKQYYIQPFGDAVDQRDCIYVMMETIGKGGTPA